jgi:hypothetical protein
MPERYHRFSGALSSSCACLPQPAVKSSNVRRNAMPALSPIFLTFIFNLPVFCSGPAEWLLTESFSYGQHNTLAC